MSEHDDVRIGITISGWPFPDDNPLALSRFALLLEELGIDSLWFTDRVVSNSFSLEPIVAMSYVAAVTSQLKFGTSVLALPLRNPVIIAKEIATIDYLSGGRCLPAFGLGSANHSEYEACGISKKDRVGRTKEMVEILRLLWSGDYVSYQGKYFEFSDITVLPKPVQASALPIWFGGRSIPALRRVAQFGDGWLTSQSTPDEVNKGIETIKKMAQKYGNPIEADHYGVLFNYCFADTFEEGKNLATPFLGIQRASVPLQEIGAFGPPKRLFNLIDRYIKAGASKFTLRPVCPPEMTEYQVKRLAKEVLPIYHG